jgi:hypothetical protein
MADLLRLAAVCGVGRHPRCATLASVGEHAFLPCGGPHGGGICVLRAGGEVILGGGRCGGVHTPPAGVVVSTTVARGTQVDRLLPRQSF